MRGDGHQDHRQRRSWGQRLFIACNVLAIVAAGLTAGVLAYGNQSVSELTRVPLAEVLARGELEEGDPENILLVGIDDASGLPEGDPVRNREPGDLAGQKTDVIMVLRLDPEAETARLLSIPRDLWVPIAGSSGQAKINSAMALGGPPGLIETIGQNFDIPIHRYLQVDMAGFRRLVEIVDGVPVLFPRPVRDRRSGLDIPVAGCYTLGPEQALGFARGRYYDVQGDDGRWHRDPGSDLSRNRRQQLFIQLAVGKAISQGGRNLNTLRQLIDLGSEAVYSDELASAGDLLDLATNFRDFDPEDLDTFSLPVRNGQVGRASVVFLEDTADIVMEVFREPDGAPGLSPPSSNDPSTPASFGGGTTSPPARPDAPDHDDVPATPVTPDAGDADDDDDFVSPLDVGPSNPNFYIAVGPPTGATCPPTP